MTETEFKYSPPIRGLENKRAEKPIHFCGPENDHIFRSIRTSRTFYEIELLERMYSELSGAKGIVLDVGANIGNHSVFFGAIAGLDTVAIEPAPKALEYLRKNIEANHLERKVTIAPFGISDVEAFGTITELKPNNIGSGAVTHADSPDCPGAVPLLPLYQVWRDHAGERPVSCIKVDVEGMEFKALSAGLRILTTFRPLVALEVTPEHRHGPAVHLLKGLGYRKIGVYCATPVWLFAHREGRAV